MDNEQSTKAHIDRLIKENDGPDLSPVKEELLGVLNELFRSLSWGIPYFDDYLQRLVDSIDYKDQDEFTAITEEVEKLKELLRQLIQIKGFRIQADTFKPFLRLIGFDLLRKWRKKNNLN
jgi:hypothetical protein